MNRYFPTLILAFVLLLIIPEFSDGGQIYKWVDENGVVHFSDSPTDSSVFEEGSTETMTELKGDESTQIDYQVSSDGSEVNSEKQLTITETSTQIYQSMVEDKDLKKGKSNYKNSQKQYGNNISEIEKGKTFNDRRVQKNSQNKQTYTKMPVVTTNEYDRRNGKINEQNAQVAAENERRRQVYKNKLNEYNRQRKRIETQNTKIRAQNERRRNEYEKRKKKVQRRNAEVRAHNERVRRLKNRNKQKPVQRDFKRKPYISDDYHKMMGY